MSPQDLKNKGNITRADIAALLKSLGQPGQNRNKKLAAIRELGLKNPAGLGGHALELTLDSYGEW